MAQIGTQFSESILMGILVLIGITLGIAGKLLSEVAEYFRARTVKVKAETIELVKNYPPAIQKAHNIKF